MELSYAGRKNRFYFFGGKDEGSAALIQGMTLAGVLLDEVALMPRSFVEQALARCSVDGSKFWFNCNPEHPQHWFYQEWILQSQQKNALYLHFTMQDNPALSPEDVIINQLEAYCPMQLAKQSLVIEKDIASVLKEIKAYVQT